MVTDAEARVADKIRKAITIIVSAAGTWLLLRVLFRLAQGRQTLLDPELFGFLILGAIAVLWIRATKRVARRSARAPDETEPASNASGSASGSDQTA